MNDKKIINLLKSIVIDGVHAAASGHPGGAMSSMDLAYILWTEFLQFAPQDAKWQSRDRFILSAGHESMLLYSLLHGVGWLGMDDLKAFRQWNSRTPGHPENLHTPGVECTTGPLGQGAGMSVGFAVAEAHLRSKFGEGLISNRTWALLGDGCMQECVTLGAASLAGHLGLSKLVWIYDKNRQQISGAIDRATSDDEASVFKGFGWDVVTIDGHDHQAIREAYSGALNPQRKKPLLIVANTTMAKGAATLEGDHNTHGAPFPGAEREKTKAMLGVPKDAEFYWPREAAEQFQRNFTKLNSQHDKWQKTLNNSEPGVKAQWQKYFGPLPELPKMTWDMAKPLATRQVFGEILSFYCEHLPNLIGGSADLEPSNMTQTFAKKTRDFTRENPQGRNMAFGVREFPMGCLANGLALYGGLIPFTATFLVFSDYFRPALRLGSIQKTRVIHELTHDSFYVGEDGPTHQPIEHLMSLRVMPDFYVMRPADPFETEIMFRKALTLEAPSCFSLTRQGLPYLKANYNHVDKGAYFVTKAQSPDLIIFATGSEVSLGVQVREKLLVQNPKLQASLVSVPCWELFFEQSAEYKNEILQKHCTNRVSMEAGTTLGWERFVGMDGLMIGIDHYGASGKAQDLCKAFGFTVDAVLEKILGKFFA